MAKATFSLGVHSSKGLKSVTIMVGGAWKHGGRLKDRNSARAVAESLHLIHKLEAEGANSLKLLTPQSPPPETHLLILLKEFHQMGIK